MRPFSTGTAVRGVNVVFIAASRVLLFRTDFVMTTKRGE